MCTVLSKRVCTFFSRMMRRFRDMRHPRVKHQNNWRDGNNNLTIRRTLTTEKWMEDHLFQWFRSAQNCYIKSDLDQFTKIHITVHQKFKKKVTKYLAFWCIISWILRSDRFQIISQITSLFLKNDLIQCRPDQITTSLSSVYLNVIILTNVGRNVGMFYLPNVIDILYLLPMYNVSFSLYSNVILYPHLKYHRKKSLENTNFVPL